MGGFVKTKIIKTFLLAAVIVLSYIPNVRALGLDCSSAILIDADSQEILFSKNTLVKRPNASTTKMLTALLALEKLPAGQKLKASKHACDAGESEIYLVPGEELKVEELVYAVMLKSANDASVVLAEAVSGNEDGFIKLMNRTAKEMGAESTNFKSPHGLDLPGHYTTAYDLAVIAAGALKNKEFAKICSTKTKIIPWAGNPYQRALRNHNDLLFKYPWIKGIKTGFTDKAGNCLVAVGEKNGSKLISVVLNSSSGETCYQDTLNLLDYGFDNYKIYKAVKKGEKAITIRSPFWESRLDLAAENTLSIRVKKNDDSLSKRIIVKESGLPIKKGQVLGKLIIRRGGAVLGETRLVSSRDVREPTLYEKIKRVVMDTVLRKTRMTEPVKYD